MRNEWKSSVWRYALAVVGYVAVVGSQSLLLYLSIKINFTVPLVATLLAVSWYGGRRPGLLLTVLFEASTILTNPIPPDSTLTQWIITQSSSFALLIFIALLTSSRRSVETKVIDTESRYRTLFDYSPDGIVIADAESYYLDANESICRMLGYTLDELIGMHASDIVDPDEIPNIGKALGVIRSQSAYERKWKFRRKDGSSFAGEVIATQMPDGNLLAVIRDVSERERSQAIVHESETRLAGIIDSAMDAIITMDSEQKIVLFNAAAEMMFKWDAVEAIGQPIERFIPERFRAAHSGHVQKFGDTHVTTRSMRSLGGIFGMRSDGEEFPIEASISQLESGGHKFFTVILRDITERTRAEARFRLAVESAPSAMIIADNAGKIILINSQTEQLFGYDRSELVGMAVETLVPERFRGRHPTHRDSFAADPQVRAMGAGRDLFGLRKDETEFPVEIGLNPIEMEGGTYVLSSIVDITARKEAEERLRNAQERLSSTLLAGSIGTWMWDIPNDSLMGDEFVARTFSLDPAAAAAGLPASEYIKVIVEEDQQGVTDRLAAAIAICGTYDIEYRVRQEDGELLWIQAKGRVEGDAEGNALNFHGAVIDITDRKRIDARFRRLVDSNAQGVFFWNTRGEITGANDAFLDIVGYTRADLEAGAIDWAAMTPPEYAFLDQRSLKTLAEKGICPPFEKEYFRKDGSRVPILLGAAIFEDSPEEGVCFLLDITERNRTQQALSQSEKHFRFLDELSRATRSLVDPDEIMAAMAQMLGKYLKVSRCAYADVESDSERFTIVHDYTDNCASTVGDYQLSLFGSKAVRTLLSGQTLIVGDVDKEMLPDDGADTFNAIGVKAIITCPLVKDGSLRAMMAVHQTIPRVWTPAEIAIVEDVVERCWSTIERRTAEEKTNRLNAELEQRVIERTAKFEAANKELESFSYSISHDLRAPLRHIDGFVQLLAKREADRLDATSEHYLKVVSDAVTKMGLLIDALLAFSRTSRVEVKSVRVDLNLIIDEAKNELGPAMSSRNIKWTIADLPSVKGDAVLLGIVITNLLSNAIKYTRARSEAHIEIGVSDETDREVTFFVRDDGAGFDMQYADKLFGVFQRLHREDEFEGIGIGLATVQRIVHRHGGTIRAESLPDKGTTFYVTLRKE